nr:DUF2911 domain-containing protein [Gemmatimonadota bacterium]NIX41530.1 DUF2911 domain-containing protein [Gemmatimonadota bacterium]
QAIRKSQYGEVMQRVADAEIEITYSRPVARGRTLFGPDGIVSYGEEWNPGADQATAIELSRDVTVNGQPLPAGVYSIWAIPGPDAWTMIFSHAGDVYHVPYPGEDRDALRLTIAPEQGDHMETLAFYFPVVEGRDAVLRFHWGRVVVPLAIHVPG